ncbi:alpha-amylase family glycosyl hydrolase [Streptomyces cocklensis]|uniref:Alpha-amylase n=1 Tax=Actinacidiphila cocklensis TaxID=887465 RepID=A0A9W4GPP7_9ACTN|nr:carbohydrate-binding module family 20 domain-containing protein [Actinacidiphila cocklensis]MDD1059271.1 alpha-amylase family glycosyl hydrolase [Actinacidiphila cocklensis]WSX73223.1 alpha-amylase family glycosyl hydrolase [Streptomyces sp. NBC_00899]WSX80711.1 alpha-amylase family glycosyl hydrolase [Streptomyces sp. NBC_00899]CAG6392472.1 Alpha-amylase [Actinacidiphila cocklensis]
MRSRALNGLLAAAVAAAGLFAASVPQAQATPPGSKDVTATLFQWRYDSVAKACTDQLGPAGYGYVEVSPATENIQGDQWWTSYQPVSYKLQNRLGNESSFAGMVSTCHAAGVKVVADAVINHMSAGSGTGTGGTVYSKYNYPGYYQDQDFHTCRTNITNYQDRSNVQNCELVGLADLDTGSDYVRSTIAGYLNHLLSLGVDGFRVDAAKHMAETDLAAIKSKLSNPNVYWAQEAIYGAGEAVQPGEYVNTGDVDAFQGAFDLKRIFSGQQLASLKTWGASWGAGYVSSDKARTFVDNWDTERNGSTLSYKDNATYTLANVYLLAWPYGSPNVYSGYEFSSNDAGPPNGGTVNACYSDGWKCQHAWPQISGMVGFRNAVAGTAVTNWWDNGNNAIAFGRGSKGFVAINHEGGALTQTFTTSLPAGTYCDVQHGGATYSVGSDGRFTATIGANDAVALYAGGPCGSTGGTTGGTTGGGTTDPAAGASFAVNASTVFGQNIYVVGDNATLGNWSTGSALLLSSASYPVWKLDVTMAAGTAFQYKYIRKDGSGNVTWESGANRTATVPASGKVVLNDTWRN